MEQEAGKVALRDESIADIKKWDVGSFPVDEVVARFKEEVDAKRVRSISNATANVEGNGVKYGE
ncbi:Threonyl-tRNA synthetase [Fimbriiglobus ruber]|uniref:Threonyl-tRNA synthetase n=1 Tax=Fimbriiglobus ruber TaxID=1908690 RepID=A0A225D9U6_9BACT|nr:Threonyl-tRNA synthetase [Fimbriiglobus ruber]